LATGRPLLVRGVSGVGKSAMAQAVAWRQGWSYVEMTVTSRTLARHFVYEIDEMKRLRDVQRGAEIDDYRSYIVPGPLFWAFEPQTAAELLHASARNVLTPRWLRTGAPNTVVLLDEIDKADPDVPNNLLEPLGRLSFAVPELGSIVKAREPPFIVLTTNEERDLPDAFLRRCIEHRIELPPPERLQAIGMRHFSKPALDPVHHELVVALQPRSIAEYLDAVRACRELQRDGASRSDLERIIQAVLTKPARVVA
jgi:MoxR-like ATPase